VLGQPGIIDREVRSHISDLSNVGTVSLVSSFSGISSRVCVTSSPLEVNVVSNTDVQFLRNEIILSSRVSLDNVSSLSTNVQVPYSGAGRNAGLAFGFDVEDVRSVLEGSAELVSVHGHLHDSWWGCGNIGEHVVVDRGSSSVVFPVNEVGRWVVSVKSSSIFSVVKISGRDVVSQSQNAVAVVVGNARKVRSSGKGPVVVIVVSTQAVSEVVVSREGGNNAIRGWQSRVRNVGPNTILLCASVLVVGRKGLSALV